MELLVNITYKNEKLEPVLKKTYTFADYMAMCRNDLLKVLNAVEEAFYAFNDNKPRGDWTDDSWSEFKKIKHVILDRANDIGRLPDNVFWADKEIEIAKEGDEA